MKKLALCVAGLLLLSSAAAAQSYDMTVHLNGGGTVTIPNDEIVRILFADVLTGVQDPGDGVRAFQLLQNYPNPFNPSTTIEYEIPEDANVTVRVYNIEGALVAELLRESQPAGRHHVMWDGTDGENAQVSSGVYFCTVECGQQALSRKLILVK